MPRADSEAIRFVRALLSAGGARAEAGAFVVETARGPVRLGAGDVRRLIADGVLAGDAGGCRASKETRGWLKRAMLDGDSFTAQHLRLVPTRDGGVLNLAESPLARLATSANGAPPFLEPHQVEAGERVRRLAERAQLQPRLTMSYSATNTVGGERVGHRAEITDMAADARRALAEIHRVLPRDCANVVFDVCGLNKGLQVVETERGWPRRSAKLVLRIGLEQLAQHYGLAPVATGAESRRSHAWLDAGARPTEFG